MQAIHRTATLAGLLLALASSAAAQAETPPSVLAPNTFDTGFVTAPQGSETAPLELVDAFTIRQGGADWVRLHFADVQLAGDPLAGTGGELRITSHLDGGLQVMNAIEVDRWRSTSAYFNGNAVQVEVWARPGTGDSRVLLESVEAGLAPGSGDSICGSLDDRLPSSDPRAGRLLPIGCTAWLIQDCAGCFLTAGHCTGNISVVEFNVPPSLSNGTIQHPGPEDQYPVDASSLQTNGGQGVGNDFAYFGTFPNGTTNLTAADAQGPGFILSSPPQPGNATIRITGFGTDSTPPTRNQVQQTHVGPLASNNGSALRYVTDTTGGNSGSPVIWEETGFAVGIHTHGGCNASGGSNAGTSFDLGGLQSFLASPQGICEAGISVLEAPSILPRGEARTVSIEVQGGAVPGSVTLHHRASSAALFEQVTMAQVGGDVFSADLPAFECGDEPEYYFSAQVSACGTVLEPAGGPVEPISARVGDALTVFETDFETEPATWFATVQGASTGQWQRGVPVNDPNWAYDPASDGDGSGSCYLTQNQLGNTDVDNGSVTLTTGVFVAGGAPEIEFLYYLDTLNPDGDDGLKVEVGVAGTWTEVRRFQTGEGDWNEVTLAPAELGALGVASGVAYQLRFIATDEGSGSVIEAGVDGFVVREVSCDPTAVGSNDCSPAVSNSTGAPATLRGMGSASLASNDLTLIAEDLPPNVFGFVVLSTDAAQIPGAGGVGTLCLGGAIGRDLASLANSGATGEIGRSVDWTMLAQPSGFVAASVGDTWRFQVWYRDQLLTLSTSNYTNALVVTVE